MERRLAAILAADVVGYARLMGADETGTLQRLTSLRQQVLEPLIAEHHGLDIIVNPYDVDAMAEAMQRALTMKREERKERWQAMMKVLQRNNLGLWRKNFLSDLGNHQER